MIKLIAHRGLKKDEKENTLEAFKKAIDDSNYVGFECDIRTTKDHVFVCVHDPIIDGKIVSLTTYQELKRYQIPTLEEVLSLETDKIFLIELKEININIYKLQELLEKYKYKNIYVMSFFNKVIKKLTVLNPKFKLGVLNYLANSEEDYSNYDFICLLEYVITDSLIAYFKEKNISVFLYGIHQLDENKYKNSDCYFIVDEKNIEN